MKKFIKFFLYSIALVLVVIVSFKFIYNSMFILEPKFPTSIEETENALNTKIDYKYINLDITGDYNNIKEAIGKRIYINNSEVDFIMITFKSAKDAKNTFDKLINSTTGILDYGKKLNFSFINLHYTQHKYDGINYEIYNKGNTVILFKSKNLNAIKKLQKDLIQ